MKIKDIKNFPKRKDHIAILSKGDVFGEMITGKKAIGNRTVGDWIKYGYNLARKEIGELEAPRLDEAEIERIIIAELTRARMTAEPVSNNNIAKALTTAYNKGELFEEV